MLRRTDVRSIHKRNGIRLSQSRLRNGRGNNLVEAIATGIALPLDDKAAYITAIEPGHVGIPPAEAFSAAGFGTKRMTGVLGVQQAQI